MNILRSILSLLLACTMAQAAPLKIGIDEADQPYMYAKDGKPAGYYPALANAIFGKLNVEILLEPKPWKKALQDADSGAAGVLGIYKNAEREAKYDYSEPFFIEKLVVYFPKGKAKPYAGIGDLAKLKVGTRQGWAYGDDYDAAARAGNLTNEAAASDEQNFGKLQAGQLDVVIATQEAGTPLAAKFGAVAAATPFSQGITYLIFPKSANQKELLKRFDGMVKAMKASGEFQKIVASQR